MRSTTGRMLLLAALLAGGASTRSWAEDEVMSRYSDDSWAGFKPGTWIKLDVSLQSGGKTTTYTRKVKLVKSEEKQQVFEYETTVDGKVESAEETQKLPEPWTVQWKETGKETLDVDGKQVECRVLERKHKMSDGETRSWRGLVDGKELEVKNVSTVRLPDGSVETGTFSVVKLNEDVKVGDQTFACRISTYVFEKTGGKVQRKTTTKSWSCASIPGGTARLEEITVEQGVESRTTTCVKSLEIAKSE